MKEDNCTNVYMDCEHCVFGFDDVTAFEEGEEVTTDPSQVLRVKGSFLCELYLFLLLTVIN